MTSDPHDLHRFVRAQIGDRRCLLADHRQALAEIRAGRKRTHWIWYVFPCPLGVSTSEMGRYYAIKTPAEARAYAVHPVLWPRLVECARAVLALRNRTALDVFGPTDDAKLRASAELFASVSPAGSTFHLLLDKYFREVLDSR